MGETRHDPSSREQLPRLSNPLRLDLTPLQATLIRSVHRGYAEIILEKELGGGYSGTRVFLILPVKPSGTGDARVVTKVGLPDALRRERDNYETHMARALPFSATQVGDYYEQGSQAALNYVFAGGETLGQTMSLEEYYHSHTAQQVIHTLTGLLDDALGKRWYGAGRSVDFLFREEYGQHLAAMEEIEASVKAIFPELTQVKGDQIQIPGMSETYPYPLQSYPGLLDTVVEGRKSLVHGDLHLRNVLVDEKGKGWLIDFAKVRERHNLFDFIKLETYVRLMALAAEYSAFSLNEYAQFEQALNAAALGQNTAPPTNRCLAKAYEILWAIRKLAQNYMRDQRNFKKEYLTALLLYSLKVMKYYQPTKPVPTQLVFITACVTAQRLLQSDPLTMQIASNAGSLPVSTPPENTKESKAGKYQITMNGAQGVVIGDQTHVEQHFGDKPDKK